MGIDAEESWKLICEPREILERYHQHTQHCSSCRGALKGIKRWQIILLAYFAVAVATASLIPDTMKLQLGLPIIASALLGLGIFGWLKLWLEPRFHFIDYVHAEKD